MFSTSGLSIDIERFYQLASPHASWYPSDWCTEHPPMYSRYQPDVLMVSPRCTHVMPPMYRTSPDVLMISPTCIVISANVLNTPRFIHDIPPMYSWYPPDVLNIPRCTEHTLYRVVIYSNIVPLNTKLFTKYMRRHPSKHIRTKKPPEKLSKCLQEHKTSTNLSDRAYFRKFSDW